MTEQAAAVEAARARHRVVVIGGGFGGLNAVRELDGADADVTVVDRTNHHLFQPLLYQVAAGILPPGLIAPALRSIIKKQANAHALLAEVMSIDLGKKEVRTEAPDGRTLTLGYDTLVVAAGATHSYFGRDEFAEFAPGMKTIEDARYLRDRILLGVRARRALDGPGRAGRAADVRRDRGRPDRRGDRRADRGAGAHRAAARLPLDQHPRGADHPAGGRAGGAAAVRQEAAGLHPPAAGEDGSGDPPQLPGRRHGRRLGHGEGSGRRGDDPLPHPDLGGRRRRPPRWRRCSPSRPVPRPTAPGRVPVNPDCTLPGHPEVFAIGDMVSLNKLPGVAQPALQEGHYVGKVIKARLAGEPAPPPFKYFDKGSMATIGYRVRRGRRVRRQGHRRARLPHVGVHPRDVPGRVGQPARHACTRGRGRWCSPRTAGTGSSPSSRRTRRSSTTPSRQRPAIDEATPPATGTVPSGPLPPGDRPAEQVPTAGREAG